MKLVASSSYVEYFGSLNLQKLVPWSLQPLIGQRTEVAIKVPVPKSLNHALSIPMRSPFSIRVPSQAPTGDLSESNQ